MSKEIIEECLAYVKAYDDARGENRKQQSEDLRFSVGKQWPESISKDRDLEGRPCLTINKTDTFVRQIVNGIRSARPQIRVHPIANGANKQKAEVLEGLIRHIQVSCNADSAYDTASDTQVRLGEGYWRVLNRYENAESFDQELVIEMIRNPFSVRLDHAAQQPDGSDAKWCVIDTMITKIAYEQQFKKPVRSWPEIGKGEQAGWITKDMVRIAEFYRIKQVADTLCMLSDGHARWLSTLPDPERLAQSKLQITAQRKSFRNTVEWYKLSAEDVLEKTTIPGRYIPVIPVYGSEHIVDGKLDRYGAVRFLRDPAQMYNYWRTAETELVALAPKAPWLVAEGQIEGHEQTWEAANRRTFSYLPYKPISNEGTPVPPPIRVPFANIPDGVVGAAAASADDMKHIAGIFDPSLGKESNEVSGVAIAKRQGASDVSNYHFYDNYVRSLRWTGKVILGMIPVIYNAKRVLRILGEDGEPESITINNDTQNEQQEAVVENDLRSGDYDVVVDTGPAYLTKRQESAASMMEFLKVLPQSAPVISDLIARNMDWPGANQVADRLAATNPNANIEKELPKDLPDNAKALISHQAAAIKQMQGAIEQLQNEHKNKMAVEQSWQETELEKARITSKTKMHDTEVRAITARDVEEIKGMIALLTNHMKVPAELKQAAATDIGDTPIPGPTEADNANQ